MINKMGWQGTFIIKTKDGEEVIHNRVMNDVLDELIKVLQGEATDLEMKYLALGTSNTAVSNSQTTLGAEIFRKQFTTSEKTGTGELTNLVVVNDDEAVAQIEEIGIFGGAGASETADSGTLISRALWSKDKTGSEEIQFTRIDRLVRA